MSKLGIITADEARMIALNRRLQSLESLESIFSRIKEAAIKGKTHILIEKSYNDSLIHYQSTLEELSNYGYKIDTTYAVNDIAVSWE